MRTVFLGTDAFLSVFKYFLERHEVAALYTGSCAEDYFRNESLLSLARENGIPVFLDAPLLSDMRKYMEEGPVLFLSADYGKKIPVPEDKDFYGINIHGSYLPEGRSYCPVECAMERGLHQTGVTVHKLSEEFDRGDILLQKRVFIDPSDDSVELYLKMSDAALELMDTLMSDFFNIYDNAVPQSSVLPYWKLEHVSSARLDPSMSVSEALRLFKIYNRILRVKEKGRVYFVSSITPGSNILKENVFLSDDILLYGLSDGHVRLNIVRSEKPEVWDAREYPFK